MASGNEAAQWGVNIIEAPAHQTRYVASVRKLSAAENVGRHHVYVDLYDEHGGDLRGQGYMVGWTWDGRRPDEPAPPVFIDKEAGEPGANVPMFAGQVLSVWIDGVVSDRVVGMHTAHPSDIDANGGNRYGHHSFHIVYRRVLADGLPGGPTPPEPPAPMDSDAKIRMINEINALRATTNRLEEMIRRIR